MNERDLGDLWAAERQAMGAWTVKLPASSLAGLPDWLVLDGLAEFWEAKKALPGAKAYDPSQLSAAQRFFQRMLARYAPTCGGVLLLDDDGWLEIPAEKAHRPMARSTFEQRMETWT